MLASERQLYLHIEETYHTQTRLSRLIFPPLACKAKWKTTSVNI